MHEEIAEIVHPVLSYGLLLQERLKRGERPDFDTEQAVLKGRLGSDLEARRLPDYGGDPVGMDLPGGSERFLGIRYALTCWLDELFILDSPWGARWNEKKLEAALYGSQDRAFRFWEQARLAEVRGTPDAVEAFYLCVMLGFRGELGGRPDRLRSWVEPTQARLSRTGTQELSLPPEREFRPNVPPRLGRDQLQVMVMVWAGVILLLLPLLVFYVTWVLFNS